MCVAGVVGGAVLGGYTLARYFIGQTRFSQFSRNYV